MFDLNKNKSTFLEYMGNVKRPGVDKLVEWLLSTDFFTAPASTKYHLNVPGGLCEHSLHVFYRLYGLYKAEYGELDSDMYESLIICGLLHDVCKTGVYKSRTRYYRDEQGKKHIEQVYDYKDDFPYGHGEKSVYLIMKHMQLTDDEAIAIRQHMGAFDVTDTRNVSNTFSTCHLAFFLHFADSYATFIDES